MSSSIKAPSGLEIKRTGNKLTLSWRTGGTYQDQQVQYSFKKKPGKNNWHNMSNVSASTKAKTLELDKSDFDPNPNKPALHKVTFRVRGKKSAKSFTDWTVKSFSVEKPGAPTLTVENVDTNASTFSWSYTEDTSGGKIFTNLQWQTILVEDYNYDKMSEATWKSSTIGWDAGSTTTKTSSHTITENRDMTNKSYRRIFRIRARGPAGNSKWVYASRTYATPNRAENMKATATDTESGSMLIDATWTADATKAHPIDKTVVQYAKAIPAAGMTVPQEVSWNDATTRKDTKDKDRAVAEIDTSLADDECIFVRVNTSWETNTAYGAPKIAKYGALSDPAITNLSIVPATHRATITATNNSAVPDSYLAVIYREEGQEDRILGIIPHGSTSVTIQCPDWGDNTVAFGVFAVVGKRTQSTSGDITTYSIAQNDILMKSAEVWDGGLVPVAPGNVEASLTDIPGTVNVKWDWSWQDANTAVLSWADHMDAWESTDEPETYEISNLNAPQWNISGLETGKVWYIRVRLANKDSDSAVYGPWSVLTDDSTVDLASSPDIPQLQLSNGAVTVNDTITAYWIYSSTDGTMQEYASIEEYVNNTWKEIGHAESAPQITLVPKNLTGWTAGTSHKLRLRVKSMSGLYSEWSAAAVVTVVSEVHAAITATTNFDNPAVEIDSYTGETITMFSVVRMPLSVTVTGAGAGGTTEVVIKRAGDFRADRPDESVLEGFDGETVALKSISGEGEITITTEDLIGMLDDTASYILTATAKDSYGQSDSVDMEFRVTWEDQAIKPDGSVSLDANTLAAVLHPIAPTGTRNTDRCDIYRLSIDKPELIVKGGLFTKDYVDPYPAIGGGYRFVYVTANGDYTTAAGTYAWEDKESGFEYDKTIIDFNGDQIELGYNLELSSSWEKDFQATRYLGGSIEGDWNDGVIRTTRISTVTLTETDPDTIRKMRRLADYAGICHVRTPDGSSYSADLQVSEDRSHSTGGRIASFTISGTKVDPEDLDGMTYEEWSA